MVLSKCRVVLLTFIVVACAAGLFVPYAYPASSTERIRERIRSRIEEAGPTRQLTIGDQIIYASATLPVFYERRGYAPAWINSNGISSQADSLMGMLQDTEKEGLRATDYHFAEIERLVDKTKKLPIATLAMNAAAATDLEFLLTDAFLIYGAHLLAGKVNPETFDPEWHARRKVADLAEKLEDALTSGSIEKTLQSFLPQQPGYESLQEALAHYKDLVSKERWDRIPDGSKLQKGDRNERVALVRKRLSTSDMVNTIHSNEEDLFDEALEQAVRQFQELHGLETDGVIGSATLSALNVPLEDRIRQIELNLERWRWLPQDLGTRYILVNIPQFALTVMEQSEPVMRMKVIVGKKYRRTPVFSDRMTYLVLSPFWNVPPSIAVKDKLPIIQKDPEYLSREHFRVFQGWGAEAQEIDPVTIDWSKLTPDNFPYRLRQDPGPGNALGPVKFMFPNKFNVYLHGTSSPELFKKNVRTLSSGCIRIEKPLDLAAYLFQDDPDWTQQKVLEFIEKYEEKTVQLTNPIVVHLQYWTAWVDDSKQVNFREDIYGRDKLLSEALSEKPPTES
jgi:murein L,D-transpeptidase YcbB/YkuD